MLFSAPSWKELEPCPPAAEADGRGGALLTLRSVAAPGEAADMISWLLRACKLWSMTLSTARSLEPVSIGMQ